MFESLRAHHFSFYSIPGWDPEGFDSYLKEQDGRWEEFKARNPLPPEMVERFERARRELSLRQP